MAGKPVQVLLFFSNIQVRPQDLDPNQLLVVRAFQEKANRLGVFYHTYRDHDELRRLMRISLREAYRRLCGKLQSSRHLPSTRTRISDPMQKTIHLGAVTLKDDHTAPQWAAAHVLSLAEYRRNDVRVTWTMKTSSPYFRFGFKYYDSRELRFSAGSIQTIGHNILFHVGKNQDKPAWFATSYKAGQRLGRNTPLRGTAGRTEASFALLISWSGKVRLTLDSKPIYEAFFPIDGIPNLALLAWGDEHEFLCEVHDLTLEVRVPSALQP